MSREPGFTTSTVAQNIQDQITQHAHSRDALTELALQENLKSDEAQKELNALNSKSFDYKVSVLTPDDTGKYNNEIIQFNTSPDKLVREIKKQLPLSKHILEISFSDTFSGLLTLYKKAQAELNALKDKPEWRALEESVKQRKKEIEKYKNSRSEKIVLDTQRKLENIHASMRQKQKKLCPYHAAILSAEFQLFKSKVAVALKDKTKTQAEKNNLVYQLILLGRYNQLDEIDLTNLNLSGVTIDSLNLSGINFSGSDLSRTIFKNVEMDLKTTKIKNCKLDDVKIKGDLSIANLHIDFFQSSTSVTKQADIVVWYNVLQGPGSGENYNKEIQQDRKKYIGALNRTGKGISEKFLIVVQAKQKQFDDDNVESRVVDNFHYKTQKEINKTSSVSEIHGTIKYRAGEKLNFSGMDLRFADIIDPECYEKINLDGAIINTVQMRELYGHNLFGKIAKARLFDVDFKNIVLDLPAFENLSPDALFRFDEEGECLAHATIDEKTTLPKKLKAALTDAQFKLLKTPVKKEDRPTILKNAKPQEMIISTQFCEAVQEKIKNKATKESVDGDVVKTIWPIFVRDEKKETVSKSSVRVERPASKSAETPMTWKCIASEKKNSITTAEAYFIIAAQSLAARREQYKNSKSAVQADQIELTHLPKGHAQAAIAAHLTAGYKLVVCDKKQYTQDYCNDPHFFKQEKPHGGVSSIIATQPQHGIVRQPR